jgi:2,4-dienoyl-CoA reductase-like NADH-dependent reductase (Old Yellow Enzyme family)
MAVPPPAGSLLNGNERGNDRMKALHAPLFEPLSLGSLELHNRVALAPTYVGMGDDRGNLTDQSLCYYYARSVGGCGLIVVEATGVTARYAFSPNFGLAAAWDGYIPRFRDLARVIHWGGAKGIVQLLLGQGAQAMRSYERRPIVGPSDVPAPLQQEGLPKALASFSRRRTEEDTERPRALTLDEIKYLKGAFIEAALRIKRAGFDGVEIHGAHGYLLAQFTSPYFNRRTDEYGGSPEKRWRLAKELIREVKDAAGPKFVVGYRFSAREWIPGGLELPEAIDMAGALVDAGADYLSVSEGCYGSIMRIFPREEGAMAGDAAAIKKAVSVPVMCPNYQDPDKAAQAIASGSADIVALSRALLADPQWPNKVREGNSEAIQACVRCYTCLRSFTVDRLPVRCSVNPMLGFERFDPDCLPRPPRKK